MSAPVIGQLAPDFTTTRQDGSAFTLSDFRGKKPVALVFFPKDDTPGCTRQLCSLRDHHARIEASGVEVVAVSFEPKEAHDAFRAKYNLTTPILMDLDREIATLYASTMDYQGQTYPARKTFVIDSNGMLTAVIDQINFEDHGSQILQALGL